MAHPGYASIFNLITAKRKLGISEDEFRRVHTEDDGTEIDQDTFSYEFILPELVFDVLNRCTPTHTMPSFSTWNASQQHDSSS